MKYTVISDIHSNLPALKKFFELYDKSTKLLCLGDIIGYGASTSECIELVHSNADVCILGNHETMLLDIHTRSWASQRAVKAIEWAEKTIDKEGLKYIESLPETAKVDGILLAHGSPCDPNEYINNNEKAMQAIKYMDELGVNIVFIGHTHVPGIYDKIGNHHYHTDEVIQLDKSQMYLINPGSVGQPRDRDPRASFCVFDCEDYTVEYYRFEYDINRAEHLINQNHLPSELGTRLHYGI